MNDIAARAGVSQATVSYVLNDKMNGRRVGQGTRKRVLDAAAELGYQRNEIARSMATGKSRVIGFIVSAPELQSAARMLAGVLDEADEQDYYVKVIRWNPEKTELAIRRSLELRLDGVIGLFMPQDALAQLHRELGNHGVPVAVLENNFRRPGTIRILSNDGQAMNAILEHLQQLGHSRIAFISSSPTEEVNRCYEDAFRTAMSQHRLNIPDGYIAYDYNLDKNAEKAARELMVHPLGPPTAIVCYRDLTAMSVLRALRSAGVSVPQQVSVVGQGDLSMARVADPALTTIALPYHELGRAVVRHLLRVIAGGENGAASEEMLPARLVVRESTAPVRNV
jgi:DNA-binding LacI/PurR family transcriptional regulator